MTRGVGRAGSTGLLGALAAIVWLALFYGLNPDLVVDFDTAPASLLTGVYPNERDPVSGRTFAWTGEAGHAPAPRARPPRRVDAEAARTWGTRAGGSKIPN